MGGARPQGSEILETAAFCIRRDAPPMLVAATAIWIEDQQFLRLTYFLEGVVEDADYETMNLGITEIATNFWSFINVGCSFVFDEPLMSAALDGPDVIYRRSL